MADSHPGFQLYKHVPVPMRDGVNLSAHVILPPGSGGGGGKFPAIFEYVPYHKGHYDKPWSRHQYFIDRGYAIVHVDIRGTGDSEGFTNTFSDPQQITDGVEVVEWIARQPWCDGNVAMQGISYVGFVCYQVAMHNPTPLKAIVVYQAMTDHYTSYQCPGGAPRPFPLEQTAALMTAYNAAPPNNELCGEKWSEIWKERLEKTKPWGLAMIENFLDGPYFRERSLPPDYGRVKAATFFIGGWADWYPDDFLRAFAAMTCPRRVLIGPWAHSFPEDALPLPRADDLRECLRWFDQYLKGKDTGVTKEPPVTLFVQEFTKPEVAKLKDNGVFRSENEWPPARAKPTEYFFHDTGRLKTSSCDKDARDEIEYDPMVGIAAGRYAIGQLPPIWGTPLDQRLDEPHSLVYSTEPLAADTEVTGHPRVVLHASSSAPIAYFNVKLCDVAPNGTSALVSKGGLNATHRESHVTPSLLEPGKTYELAFDLQAMAYVFKAGHRIRVMLACADVQHAWPTPFPAINTIHRSAKFRSRIVLPIVPPQSPALPPPSLMVLDQAPPAHETIPAPEYGVSRDFVRDEMTVSYRINVGAGVNRSALTVSAKTPADAAIKCSYEYNATRVGMAIKVTANCVTASDEKSFHHVVQLEVKINDRPHFQRSWSSSVPRKFC